MRQFCLHGEALPGSDLIAPGAKMPLAACLFVDLLDEVFCFVVSFVRRMFLLAGTSCYFHQNVCIHFMTLESGTPWKVLVRQYIFCS